MRVSRARLVVLGVFMCGSAIGHHTAVAAASAPSVTVHRITAFNGNVAAADFSGDGVIDVVATGSAVVAGGHPVVVAPGKGDGSFGAPIATALNGDVLATGDFNTDGLPDLIAEDAADDSRLRILLNTGGGHFGPPAGIGGAVRRHELRIHAGP
jgi:hypothetical protein